VAKKKKQKTKLIRALSPGPRRGTATPEKVIRAKVGLCFSRVGKSFHQNIAVFHAMLSVQVQGFIATVLEP
jgi:hypothetical protein